MMPLLHTIGLIFIWWTAIAAIVFSVFVWPMLIVGARADGGGDE